MAACGLFALGVFELVLFALIPDIRSNDLFKTIALGTWQAGILLVAAYYFGSSKGSTDKNATIDGQLGRDGK